MRRQDLSYNYPEELIAREPAAVSRIAWVDLTKAGDPREIQKVDLFSLFSPGDVLVINDTKVEKRRVFAGESEILFVRQLDDLEWEVLLPSRHLSVGDRIPLPGGVVMTLAQKGLPQRIRLNEFIGPQYFALYGEPALPPYIQRARGERHARPHDETDYQSDWAEVSGSSAAPTASLHFTVADLNELKGRGVHVEPITLHVGLGTFLPVKADELNDHKMHSEEVYMNSSTIERVRSAQGAGHRVWALGTTVTRALESWAGGRLKSDPEGGFYGPTDLFIQPGYSYQVVDCLMTNFHQPESTLLALVAAFAGLDKVKSTYAWAIENRFRLFSYGDLSVWRRR